MSRIHFIFGPERLNCRCVVCGDFTGRPHCTEGVLTCEAHCTTCSPRPPAERTGPVVATAGTQDGLFT